MALPTALCPNMRACILVFFHEPRERGSHTTTEHFHAYFLRVRTLSYHLSSVINLKKVTLPVTATYRSSLLGYAVQSSQLFGSFFLEHSLILPFPMWAYSKSKMSVMQWDIPCSFVSLLPELCPFLEYPTGDDVSSSGHPVHPPHC